ncbi:peptidase S1 and S6 chymotrypsin/Hap [Candidatus Vecturithrix granuli]|uniref:Peptidase S1 and S6 chymotrypsin/Hap n=1 Tax=Vecturithrix granuli TaxID=1499967 RepID=A0A081C018_VECG1|nr:peptidase S1 and S6 chymotrypsin/Hap [Candidatus Vecturithrix granuli]
MKKQTSLLVCSSLLMLGIASSPIALMAQEMGQKAHGIAREHYYQGVFYGKQENYQEAILELEQAIQADPGYADAYNALAVVYHRQKQYQQAIENYLMAIETNPGYVKARTNLAMIYHEQGHEQKALQQLEEALKYDSSYEPAQKLLGSVKNKVEAQEAQERLQQQAQAAARKPAPSAKPAAPPKKPTLPSTPTSVFIEGTRLILQGQLDAGIQAYQQGLQKSPRSAEGYTLLGLAAREKYRLTHDPAWRDQEVASFTKALQYDPQYLSALLGLGEFYYEQGLLSTAFAYFQQVLHIQPDHPAQDQLEAILRYAR